RPADSEGSLFGAAPWLRRAAADRTNLGRGAQNRAGGSLSGLTSPGTAGNARRRVGCFGKQSPGEVLQFDANWAQAGAIGDGFLGAVGERDESGVGRTRATGVTCWRGSVAPGEY